MTGYFLSGFFVPVVNINLVGISAFIPFLCLLLPKTIAYLCIKISTYGTARK